MRRLIALLLLCFTLSGPYAGPAQAALKRVAGEDWLLMTRQEKTDYTDETIKSFRSRGVPIELPASYYVDALDYVTSSPKTLKADIANLLASLAYKKEPASRAALDEMKKRAQSQPRSK